jgi:hypothetical protein
MNCFLNSFRVLFRFCESAAAPAEVLFPSFLLSFDPEEDYPFDYYELKPLTPLMLSYYCYPDDIAPSRTSAFSVFSSSMLKSSSPNSNPNSVYYLLLGGLAREVLTIAISFGFVISTLFNAIC